MADDGGMSEQLSPEEAAFRAVFPHGLPANTRAASPSAIVRTFPLTEEHLVKIKAHAESGAVLGTEDHRLARLKPRHHRLAMLIAGGMEPERAALACRYHPTTVGILIRDPMFAELLELYRDGVSMEFQDTIADMRELTDEIIAEIAYRLEENPKQFTPTQLNDFLRTLADRSGHGPSSTVRNLSVALDGNDIRAIKAEAAGTGPASRQPGRLAPEHQRAIEGVFAVRGPGASEPGPQEGVGSGAGDGVRAQGAGPPADALFADDAEDGGVD